jgi:hypothetical protein
MLAAVACSDDTSPPAATPDAALDSATTDVKVDVVDAAACAARDTTGFTPSWKPPAGGLHRGVCSIAQLTKLVECAHIPPSQLTASCKSFAAAPENATCVACTTELLGRALPVCVAIATGDTSETGCAARFDAYTQCSTYACAACPEPLSAADGEARANLARCLQAAQTGPCKSYWDAAACFLPFEKDAGAAPICHNTLAPSDYFLPLICGADTSDAGADSSTDASVDAPTDAPIDG